MADIPKEPCPQCGKPLNPTYIPSHLRSAHNIYGGKSGKARAKKPGTLPEKVQSARKNGSGSVGLFKELPAKLLVDENGDMWVAERLGR